MIIISMNTHKRECENMMFLYIYIYFRTSRGSPSDLLWNSRVPRESQLRKAALNDKPLIDTESPGTGSRKQTIFAFIISPAFLPFTITYHDGRKLAKRVL
jgi:hypothetical protein